MNTLKHAMIGGLAGLGVLAAAAPALAQPTPHQYYLRAGSTDQEGCFGACACATTDPEPMRGTFTLTPDQISPVIAHEYMITDVTWRAPFFPRAFTGSGTFAIVVGTLPQHQNMALTLSADGGDPQTFDSGSVPNGPPAFPLIQMHLTIPDVACWHTELEILATPLMADWNADGTETVQDIFDFLTSWFAGDGDANEDGATTVQDIFDFLEAWFAGT